MRVSFLLGFKDGGLPVLGDIVSPHFLVTHLLYHGNTKNQVLFQKNLTNVGGCVSHPPTYPEVGRVSRPTSTTLSRFPIAARFGQSSPKSKRVSLRSPFLFKLVIYIPLPTGGNQKQTGVLLVAAGKRTFFVSALLVGNHRFFRFSFTAESHRFFQFPFTAGNYRFSILRITHHTSAVNIKRVSLRSPFSHTSESQSFQTTKSLKLLQTAGTASATRPTRPAGTLFALACRRGQLRINRRSLVNIPGLCVLVIADE